MRAAVRGHLPGVRVLPPLGGQTQARQQSSPEPNQSPTLQTLEHNRLHIPSLEKPTLLKAMRQGAGK